MLLVLELFETGRFLSILNHVWFSMPCIYCFLLLIKQNSSSLNCFAFADADFMPKTDVVRGPASAGAKGSALTIHTLFIKGRKELVGAM